jgi:cation diffusion facilitator family transporter
MSETLPHRHDDPGRDHSHGGHHSHGDHDHSHGDHDHSHGGHDHSHGGHDHSHGDHSHSHGLVDPSIKRSREGLRAVGTSLAVLLLTAVLQAVVFALSGSVALLADLVHNGGDALTAVPLAVAFLLRSAVAERRAGYVVVVTIFASAVVAAVESVLRLVNPQSIDHLGAVVAAGVVGFLGNEIAAQVRLRAGRRLDSAALVADGNHARTDGLVSLSVVAGACAVAIGLDVADPLIGLAIAAVILRITWQSWRTISAR